MSYNFLDKAGLRMPNIRMGTVTFGFKISTQQKVGRAVAMALEEGINFSDAADQYVGGMSEVVLGRVLGEARREAVVVGKVGYLYKGKTFSSLLRPSILDDINEALRRLGTDYMDIHYLHVPDYHTSLEESPGVANDVVCQGKARYTGMSNYVVWQLYEAMYICHRNHWTMPVVSETCYSALTRNVERELVPLLTDKEMRMTTFNPLAGGLLTGKCQSEVSASGIRFENPVYQK